MNLRSGHGRQIRGITLVELIIAAGLTILFFSLVISFLIPVMRASVLGTVRTGIQQEAVRALNSVVGDVRRSASAGLSLFSSGTEPETGPVYLGIIRLLDVNHLGNQQWETALIVYSWKGRGQPLIRKTWSAPPPSLGIALAPNLPQRVPRAALSSIADEPSLQGVILAKDVAEFRIDSPDTEYSISSPLTVEILIQRKAATGRNDLEKVRFSRTIDLRNQI
jgi:hypothetical protein